MSAVLAFGIASVASPGDVLGATVSKTVQCNANVRTSASTSARVKSLIRPGTKVSVVATVTGAHYRTSCLGKAVSASSWYRISAIDGRSVSSLYGVSYVYSATSLFKPTPYTRYAACTTYLRTKPTVSSKAKLRIVATAKVLVATKVTGGSWSRSCAGEPVHGKSWYRVSAVNGRSVKSLYGVSYLYAPAGLFNTAAAGIGSCDARHGPHRGNGEGLVHPGLEVGIANNSVGLIIVANGTYHVTPAASEASDALGIGLAVRGSDTGQSLFRPRPAAA